MTWLLFAYRKFAITQKALSAFINNVVHHLDHSGGVLKTRVERCLLDLPMADKLTVRKTQTDSVTNRDRLDKEEQIKSQSIESFCSHLSMNNSLGLGCCLPSTFCLATISTHWTHQPKLIEACHLAPIIQPGISALLRCLSFCCPATAAWLLKRHQWLQRAFKDDQTACGRLQSVGKGSCCPDCLADGQQAGWQAGDYKCRHLEGGQQMSADSPQGITAACCDTLHPLDINVFFQLSPGYLFP